MLDFSHTSSPVDVQWFFGSGGSNDYLTWIKPRGKSMAKILLVGSGGNGGSGVIGANSTAGGGAGGGSGAQTSITVPLWALPDVLYLLLRPGGSGGACRIQIYPESVVNDYLLFASCGANGGNASGGTGGSSGTAAAVAGAGNMPLGWQWLDQALAGQAGITGGGTGSGSNLTLPTTGLLVTGGTGGGGLAAAGQIGNGGGTVNAAGVFPSLPGGLNTGSATTPPGNGQHGYSPIAGLTYFYGGTGGGSTHGSATGAGLVQASGGNGAPGCGGGGSGGALTGSVAGTPGMGGPAFCLIVCW